MITADRPMMTLHVEIEPQADPQRTLLAVRRYIREHIGIDHATIQIETTGCLDREAEGHVAGSSPNPRSTSHAAPRSTSS
jgi:hypothetical protein